LRSRRSPCFIARAAADILTWDTYLDAESGTRPTITTALRGDAMYEFHGWIRLADSPSEIDEGALDDKTKILESMISSIEWVNGKIDLLTANGVHTLIMNAVPNRRRDEADDLATLLSFVVDNFKGAYGIVYEYDEQTRTEYGRGVFSVNVIKRGTCTRTLDPFLSPLVPVAEDP
jgi:hypothetical protein